MKSNGSQEQMMDGNGDLVCQCKGCKNRWVSKIDLPLDMIAFNRAMEKIRCPSCGAKSKRVDLVFGTDALGRAGFDGNILKQKEEINEHFNSKTASASSVQ